MNNAQAFCTNFDVHVHVHVYSMEMTCYQILRILWNAFFSITLSIRPLTKCSCMKCSHTCNILWCKCSVPYRYYSVKLRHMFRLSARESPKSRYNAHNYQIKQQHLHYNTNTNQLFTHTTGPTGFCKAHTS